MGSYAGSSDWDDVPSTTDAQRFAPSRKVDATEAADENLVLERPTTSKPLNLVMAFDTTGSMRAYIHNVREKIDYLAQGLFKLMDIRIALIGVGDHCDDRFMLQPFPLTNDIKDLRKAVHDVRSTSGGDYPEAFECLFKFLNEDPRFLSDIPTVLVLITDSVPHGMSGAGDAGCPDGVDARVELAKLLPRLRSFYLVNCGNHEASIRIQRTMVKSENYFVQMNDFRRLTNLIMAVCMDEVGELDFFMNLLEKQRGKDRRAEVLTLLKK
jgi:Mg-chelatase subunit ChlD